MVLKDCQQPGENFTVTLSECSRLYKDYVQCVPSFTNLKYYNTKKIHKQVNRSHTYVMRLQVRFIYIFLLLFSVLNTSYFYPQNKC